MAQENSTQDPLDFVRGMWNNMGFTLPGMVTPTVDIDELDKRIKDMRAVESWLKMNLSMLQMTIQGLDMQRATLSAVKAMSQQQSAAPGEAPAGDPNPFAQAAAMWPWNFMSGQQTDGDGAAAKNGAADDGKPRARANPKPSASDDK